MTSGADTTDTAALGRAATPDSGAGGFVRCTEFTELPLREVEFNRIRVLVARHTGIHLTESKHAMVCGRLSRRLRILGMEDYSSYCDVVETPDNPELQQFINALTTNLSSFFRESRHFDLLRERLAEHRPGKLRIWSAGCAMGQEPYSIAMVLMETLPDAILRDIRIVATDIDSNVVAAARAGIFTQEQAEGVSAARLQRWFLRGRGGREGLVKVRPELRNLIEFRQHNLMDCRIDDGLFDAIYCRNVQIYFERATRDRLLADFARLQPPGALLVLGHAETAGAYNPNYRLVDQNTYVRTTNDPDRSTESVPPNRRVHAAGRAIAAGTSDTERPGNR